MILSRTYASRKEIPQGAEALYTPTGNLFILNGAKHDIVADNPWEGDNWNLTEQGRFISQYGLVIAAAFAKIAGTKIGGLKPRAAYQPSLKVLIQKRDVTTNIYQTGGGGGGTDDALVAGLVTKT
jgi:hypothetical protein